MKMLFRLGIFVFVLCGFVGDVFGQSESAATLPSGCEVTVEVAADQIVVVRLDGEVIEAPPGIDIGLPDLKMNLFWDQLRVIRMVADDPAVKALVLLIDQPSLSLAQSQQIAIELTKLRKSGKQVYVHADSLNTALYLLSVRADEIYMSPGGMLELSGVAAEVMYYKGLMGKLGIEADVEHHGDFKLAAEPYTSTQPSRFMDEQMNDLIDNLYDQIVMPVACFRGLNIPQVKLIIDQGPFVSEQAMEAKLIDGALHRGQTLKKISKELDGRLVYDYGISALPDIQGGFGGLMQLFSMIGSKASGKSANQIAIVYVTGTVMPGESDDFFGSAGTAGSVTMRKAFAQVMKDHRIKAVVLRINSPGGSSSASEVIWQLVRDASKKKPVIVSMGDVAGSGGYYIAAAGSYIYASPSTLTGSIGVVAGKPVFKKLLGKLELNSYTYSRGKNAGMYGAFNKLTASQRKNVRDQMDIVFGQFKDRVLQGRKGKIANLSALATGRVYTGTQGVQLGLVDRIGSLADAVDHAAKEADLTNYEVVHLPKPRTIPELILEGLGYKLDPEVMSRMMRAGGFDFNLAGLKILGVDAGVIRETLEIAEMLKDGGVLMISPYHIEIR